MYGNRPPPINGGKPKTESSFDFTIQTQTIMRLIGHHIGQCIICSDNSNTYFVAKPGQPFDLAEQRAGLAQAAQLEILEGCFTAYKALKALPHIVHLQPEQYALLERAAETHNSDIFEAMADMLLP